MMGQPQNVNFDSEVSSSESVAVFGDSNSTFLNHAFEAMSDQARPNLKAYQDIIRNAVYLHIQAVRSMGRTSINTAEIAEALGVPRSYVDAAVKSLSDRGVKAIR